MLTKVPGESLGTSDLGWLHSRFHFSFAEYHDPGRMGFGVLRVLNDDIVEPGNGFGSHPHSDFEIVSYVVEGQLTHADSMGNRHTIGRGQVQFMSAGTGIVHSEYNRCVEPLRFLQLWIHPDGPGHEPRYGDYPFTWEARRNHWLQLVSGPDGTAPVKINQDVTIGAVELDEGRELSFAVPPGRQAYLVQVEGSSTINETPMEKRDALEVVGEDLIVGADTTSHLLVVEMPEAA